MNAIFSTIIKHNISLTSAGYLTYKTTQEYCKPMPSTVRDYVSFGSFWFGLYAWSVRSYPLLLPIFCYCDFVCEGVIDSYTRRRDYIINKK